MLPEFIMLITKTTIKSLSRPSFWIITLGVIFVCFLSGPFGTFDKLPNGFRFIYWSLIVFISSLISLWAHALISTQQWTSLSKITIVSFLFGLIIAGVVILLSLSLLHPIQRYPGHIKLFAYSFPSAAIIFMFSTFLSRSGIKSAEIMGNGRPDLFSRLEKYQNARKILSLSSQDHYLEITTEMGAELCLMRLNDAIALTVPEEGFQIHRSHWVARSAVKKLNIKGSSRQVCLIDGRVLNISQSRLKEFKAFLK